MVSRIGHDTEQLAMREIVSMWRRWERRGRRRCLDTSFLPMLRRRCVERSDASAVLVANF
jgi:hypothetical protein